MNLNPNGQCWTSLHPHPKQTNFIKNNKQTNTIQNCYVILKWETMAIDTQSQVAPRGTAVFAQWLMIFLLATKFILDTEY